MSDDIKTVIQTDIDANRVVLYMKGNKMFPQCGFSAHVISLLNKHGVGYETRNVLDDASLRQGIKEFANWPTIPQLYVDGKFVGGCDIIIDLDGRGELETLLKGSGSTASS